MSDNPSNSSSSSSNNNNNTTSEKDNVYIGLDVGTQSTKALLYHPHSQTILGRSSVPYDLSPNPDNIIGRAEQSPTVWIDAVVHAINGLSTRFNLSGDGVNNNNENDKETSWIVKGIGVSGQQHGMVALSDTFEPVRDAKLWCDVEAADEAKDFSEQATALLQQDDNDYDDGTNRKWSIPPGFTSPKVLWFRKHEEMLYNFKTRWIVLPHDYVNLYLRGATLVCTTPATTTTSGTKRLRSGENVRNSSDDDDDGNDGNIVPTTDAGDASGTGIFDPITRTYDKRLASIIDPTNKYYTILPKILPPNAICGTLHDKIKQKLNIDVQNQHNVYISVGSGDNMCSALGCGCVSPGMAVLSLGTSGTIFGVSDEPVRTGTEIAPFCDATGRHLPLACVMSCTGVLNSVLENWCCSTTANNDDDDTDGGGDNDEEKAKKAKTLTHEEATNLAALHPPGCYGITFLPYLGGERTPNWPHATASLLGLSTQNISHFSSNNERRIGLFYRLALEGITYLLADSLDSMKKACNSSKDSEKGGFHPKRLLVVGGGSKNKLWRQMIADVLDLELCFPLEAESAALGAAFQAGAATAAAECSSSSSSSSSKEANGSSMSVEEYVSKQKIEMEETIVKPTEDEEVKKLYQDGLERYRKWSKKLFESSS